MSEAKKSVFKKILASAGGGIFVLVMVAIFLTPVIPMTIGKSTGYYPALMDMLSKCPEATAALGANPRAATLGLNTGSCSGSGSSTWSASGRMPVKGDKGGGTLHYSMAKSGDTITLYSATLSAGDKDINVAECLKREGIGKGGAGGGSPQDPPQPKVREE